MEKRDIVYQRLLGANRIQPLLDEQVSTMCQHVYDLACEEIHDDQGYYGSEESEGSSDETVEEMIHDLVRLADIFKKSQRAQSSFMRNFRQWAPCCKDTIQKLREFAQEMKDDKLSRDKTRAFSSLLALAGGLVALLNPATAPLAVGGAISFVVGNGIVIRTTQNEIKYVEETLKKVQELLNKENERFSSMKQFFSRTRELENILDSLLSYDILKEIAGEVQKLTEKVTGEKDMTEAKFKDQFQQVVKQCMGLMGKDTKMIEKYGKEFAPAVMSFIFSIFLLKDHNRIVIDSSLIIQNLVLSLKKTIDFSAVGSKILSGCALAEAAVSEIFVWIAVAVDAVILILSCIDIWRQPETKYTQQIQDAADKLEKVYNFIEMVYNESRRHQALDELSQQVAIMVSNLPDDARLADLKKAVNRFLPEEAWSRVDYVKLPTKDWVVWLPENHSKRLKQQQQIEIKGRDCKVIH